MVRRQITVSTGNQPAVVQPTVSDYTIRSTPSCTVPQLLRLAKSQRKALQNTRFYSHFNPPRTTLDYISSIEYLWEVQFFTFLASLTDTYTQPLVLRSSCVPEKKVSENVN